MELVCWYNIGRNLGLFTAYNAGLNDTCLRVISMALHNDYKVRSRGQQGSELMSLPFEAFSAVGLDKSRRPL
jgi:hypothetical protein